MKKRHYALGVTVVILLAGWWYVTRSPSSPFDGVQASATPAPVEQTAYAARLSGCVACHSVGGGLPFAGRLEMGTRLGSIFSTNITPDPDHGMGRYSLADFDQAVRHGVTSDGRRLYPAIPHPSYAKLSVADVQALYDYFMHQVQPAVTPNQQTAIKAPLNQR